MPTYAELVADQSDLWDKLDRERKEKEAAQNRCLENAVSVEKWRREVDRLEADNSSLRDEKRAWQRREEELLANIEALRRR